MEAPGFFVGGYIDAAGDCNYFDHKASDNNPFPIDDLLDFPKEDEIMPDFAFFNNITGNPTSPSTLTAVDSCNSSGSGTAIHFSGDISSRGFTDAQFSGELCVPCDDLAELEWLTNFVDSFPMEDLHELQLISATKLAPADTSSSETAAEYLPVTAASDHPNALFFSSDVSVPGKARSKRSRAAPGDWSSRLAVLSSDTTTTTSTSKPSKTTKTTTSRRREAAGENPTRKCLHCASEKTPQWRAGPMGPKTLCNACGVRYKSGRLVPEYRPAASPTFVSTKHSNSHRKVLDLRRRKELQRQQQQQLLSRSSILGISDGGDYLIHHRSGLVTGT